LASEPTGQPSALAKTGRVLGGTWLGVSLLLFLALFLAVASTAYAWLPDGLGRDSTAVYDLWPVRAVLLTLSLAVCVNIAAACLFRVPRRCASLGAWICHAGLLVLVAGSMWYALAAVTRADSITVRTSDGRWSEVRHVYLNDTFAVYLQDANGVRQAPVDLGDGHSPRDLDVPLASGPGWQLRAAGFLPGARILSDVRLRVTDANQPREVMLSPESAEGQQFLGNGYQLMFHPNVRRQQLAKMLRPMDPNVRRGLPNDLGLLLTGEEITPTLMVLHRDGTQWHAVLRPGAAVEAPLAGREVKIELLETIERAEAMPADAPAHHGLTAVSVLQVVLTSGGARQAVVVPFHAYGHLAPPQVVRLGDGRALGLGFSRRRLDLPATLQVTETRFETWPGSVVPKDYVCLARVDGRDAVISLNNPLYVGPFQLSQGSWAEDPRDPDRIFFTVATRPGLPVIWAGCILICLGFPLAFYLKPLLLRRERTGVAT
jgi:hypothetical protein